MKRWLWALLLATQAAAATSPDNYPRIGCYAATAGGGFPLHDGSAYQTATMRHLARFQLVTINVSPWLDLATGCADSLRAYHPQGPSNGRMTILGYDQYGVRFDYATPNYIWYAFDQVWKGVSNGYLKSLDGTGFANATLSKYCNLGLTPYVVSYDSVWKVRVIAPHKLNGLFFDTTYGKIGATTGDTGQGVDYTTAGYASVALMDTARSRNLVLSQARMRDAGSGPIVLNGYMPDSNATRATFPSGQMFENWGHFITPLDAALIQVKAAGPYTMIAAYTDLGSNTTDQGTAARYDAAHCAKVRGAVAAGCICGAYACFGANRDLPTTGTTYLDWWYDEYSVNPATGKADSTGQYVGWMGQPKADAKRDFQTGVWYREFEHGFVLLNPNSAAVSVPFGQLTHRRWRRINGNVDTTVNNGKDEACPTLAGLSSEVNGSLVLVEVSPGQ